ncbi:hypothetical protein GCM10009525_29950 [Streptosporangium amethystogenes subsp. fukuiense]
MSLSPRESGLPSGPDAMFAVTVRREYRVTSPSPAMRFACVSSRENYRELLEDPSSTFVWFFPPAAGLTGELVQFTVDGRDRNIRRSGRAKGQVFTVTTGTSKETEPREVTISYTFRTRANRGRRDHRAVLAGARALLRRLRPLLHGLFRRDLAARRRWPPRFDRERLLEPCGHP